MHIITLFMYCIFTLSLQANTFVIIRGTANTGKSTLCKAFHALDSSYIIISQDDLCRKITYDVCKNAFPAEMAIISKVIHYENIPRAIRYFEIILKEEINENETQLLMEAINRIKNFFDDPAQQKQIMSMKTMLKYKVIETILFYAACGNNVILDSWGYTNWDHELEQLKECFNTIISVAVYCDLKTVINRWKKRNAEALEARDLTERRLLCQMLNSFFGFLKPNSIDDCKTFIISKQEFDELMLYANKYIKKLNSTEEAKAKVTKEGFSMYEFTLEDLFLFKEKIYKQFNFDNIDQVALIPSVSYDILLCTEGNCSEYTFKLLKQINNVSKN